MNAKSKLFKMFTSAADSDAAMQKARDYEGQLRAVHKAQAVIEFNLDGTILTANENFLKATGYSLEEIKGKHHRIFVDPAYRESSEYRSFWEKLGRGEYDASARMAGRCGCRRATTRSWT